jgi:tetratricopeptide (TPR) repeat protein
MSICYSKQKKYDEALKVINDCIRNNPEYAKALIKRGELNT